jgi:two-component system, OmpR family, phosphate regulon response regulator OmpR
MHSPQDHILIVDDDNRILSLLKKFFSQEGFLVSAASNVPEAQELLLNFRYDLIVLDVMLPGVTGLEFAKNIKASGSTMPIIMLTALSEPHDRIKGLESGAMDYLTKPFEPRELLLRVKNLIDSYKKLKKEKRIARFGNNYYDYNSKEFIRNGKLVNLSSTEQVLLETLLENPGCVVSRAELSTKIGSLRTIDVQITRIRSKIEDNPKEPKYLKTIRGQGYALYT